MAQDFGLVPVLHLDLVDFSRFSSDERDLVLQLLQSWLKAATSSLTTLIYFWKKWERLGTG